MVGVRRPIFCPFFSFRGGEIPAHAAAGPKFSKAKTVKWLSASAKPEQQADPVAQGLLTEPGGRLKFVLACYRQTFITVTDE